ncbi:MarR family transcriptional regulator [Streptomyces brevispora]|uniref:MarR family transcriptional regulator n=1 Tax=Streptomyces brevispora TaxID=887462 RepID=UPI0035D93EC9
MATQNLSPALRAPASSRPYPKAKPGYGKQSVPDERPPHADDFMLLPERERNIAGYVSHLPDGAAMDIKSLAKRLPLYGQMAVGSALRALGVAGHLRHVRCLVGERNQVRWVTRTFWSRTARDNEWWNTFLAAQDSRPARDSSTAPEAAPTAPPPPWVPTEPPARPADAEAPAPAPVALPEPTPPAPVPAVPQQRTPEPAPAGPSPAYLVLAQLGRIDARLALSAVDCAALEGRAAEWLARGVNTDYLTHALTAGLPAQVDSPVGFLRRRLNDKIPPHLPAAPAAPHAPTHRVMAECTECGRPGPSEAFPDGLCRPCREAAPDAEAALDTEAASDVEAAPALERDIRLLVSHFRDLCRLP